jgi:dTDP-glucose 4,6-dehydratase
VANLLVTGGAGFIGANFVHYWLDRHPGDHVVVLDALTYAGNRASLEPASFNPRLAFVHGDICAPGLAAALLREHRVTTLVHFAAESHVDRSITGPDPFLGTNVMGTHALLKAARQVWLEEEAATDGPARFHHISTDEVYGSLGPGDPPFTEESPYRPSSPYAASKAASDHLVRVYHRTYGLPITVSVSSNNYGRFQFPEKLIPFMLIRALEGEPLPVYGDGLQIRDWLHVEDHCTALEQVLTRGGVGETYNIGGGSEWTNLEVVDLLCRLLDEAFAVDGGLVRRFPRCPASRGLATASLITHVPDRPGHDRRYAISSRKLEAALGYRPLHRFEIGLRETVAWYLEHEEWWRPVLNRSYRAGSRQPLLNNVSF